MMTKIHKILKQYWTSATWSEGPNDTTTEGGVGSVGGITIFNQIRMINWGLETIVGQPKCQTMLHR